MADNRHAPFREFVAFFLFVGWDSLQLGVHLSLLNPNLEIHVPFGFFKIGWVRLPSPVNGGPRTFYWLNKGYKKSGSFRKHIQVDAPKEYRRL